ncbi:MAG: hypothetical protein U9Q12_03330 [Patescibacteria group bacterium]|nr:hypothetical protein [Patescibacteria group bacterium]
MQIAKTVKSIDKTLRGVPFTQKSEIFILTDISGNYFIKSAGRLTKMSREDAQDYFQKNFNDFWKYLELNKLYEQLPELYTKEEALEIQQCYATTPKKKVTDNNAKIDNYYANFTL